MSDGLSASARAAENNAHKFIKENYPEVKATWFNRIPKHGQCLIVYETWLNHIIEIIKDRKLIKRFMAKPYGDNPIKEIAINDENWQIGYYNYNPPTSRLCG